jgi:selenocysteine-specific elongation factor
VDTGAVVDAGNGVAFAGEAYTEMVEKVVAALREKPAISLAEVRDLFGTSRRYAQALLEHLDSKRITLRRGDDHVLGPSAPPRASQVDEAPISDSAPQQT